MKKLLLSTLIVLSFTANLSAKRSKTLSQDDTYTNPIIHADYSDPDVIRVEDDYYMIASSFNCLPGIPVLHSTDLVHWEIINHVIDSLPFDRFNLPVHGRGAWAPCLRYHDGKFYVYVCTPDEGLFVAITDDILGKWELTHVAKVQLWEDPSPLWDDDGDAYLVRSKLGGSLLYLHKMSPDGKSLLDDGVVIFDDPAHKTIEGPKFMKHNGYYYINAPAGGVVEGWQTSLRSKSIYGPYEAKIVLEQGSTEVNGPHQGGLVDTKSGEWWFIHFQAKGAYGRIAHLQPVEWVDGWPMMGVEKDGVQEPVMSYKKPNIPDRHTITKPQTSDEFDASTLALQWQWHANPQAEWYSLSANPGKMRLYSAPVPTHRGNLHYAPNLLLQKFPTEEFSATTSVEFTPELQGEKCGLVVMGNTHWYLSLQKSGECVKLRLYTGRGNNIDDPTELLQEVDLDMNSCHLRVDVTKGAECQFSYSLDGETFTTIGDSFAAKQGGWIGAKVGIFSVSPSLVLSGGYADFENFIID
ncbi:MAG: glycoside hydrolase 43 family protein [Rikenellaceae bacterium]